MSELYQLPDGWEWKTFDEVSTFIRGITFKPNEKFDEPNKNTIFCFRTTNIQIELDDSDLLNIDLSLIKSDEKLIKNGDILISSANSLELLGKCCLIRNINYKATLGGFIVCGRANQEILDTKYYYYYFSSESNQNKMRNLANKTTGIANLPMKKVEKEYIPLPPLEEQKRIVAKLDILFAKIDKAIALHQKNIDEANVFMASVLNDVFVELEEKYEKKKLNEIIKIIGGGTPSKANKEYWENGTIKWATVGDMNVETITKTELSITEIGLKNSSSNIIPKNGIIIATRVGLGKVCYLEDDIAINQDLKGLIPKDDKLSIRYLFNFFKNIEKYILSNGTGATVKGVKLEFIKELELPLPNIKTQQKVVSYLDEISQKMEKIKQIQKEKMQSLKALKASILDQAFKGEL